MKFINYKLINKQTGSYYIDYFDIEKSESDKKLLLHIINLLFSVDQRVFFLFSIPNGNSEKEYFEKYFSENGRIKKLEDINLNGISYLGELRFNKQTSDQILKLWQISPTLSFFKPYKDLQFDMLASYKETIFDPHKDCKKMFGLNVMHFVIIKGVGGESLTLNFKLDYELPDVEFAINNFKNK